MAIARNLTGCEKWIKAIGKRKIQSFQDSFADLYNISLGIIDLEGKSVTVWSNSSLFCHLIMQKNRERCKSEQQRVIDNVINNQKIFIFTCYLGITYFACPIFFNEEMVAICLGGGVYLEEEKILFDYKIAKDVPVFSKSKLNDCVGLLENIFNLLNVHENVHETNKEKENELSQEVLFLEKKLSRREFEVIKFIRDGLTNKEISAELNISEKTVKTHITNILRKLNMKDRMQIIIFCRKQFKE